MASRFFTNLAKQIVLLVAMWQVFALTNRPLMLGLIGLVQGIPFILGSFWAGHLVDRREKRALILASVAALAVSTAALAALSHLDRPPLIGIYALVGASALFTSLELPAASSYLQIMIPSDAFPKAAAWNLANYVGATVLGPVIGGLLLERTEPAVVYWISAATLGAGFALAAPLRRIPPPPVVAHESAWRSVISGLRFVAGHRIIFVAMVLDSFAVLFGEVVFILPVFAEMLGAGPLGLGLLRAAPALGSCAVSLAQAVRPLIRVSWSWLQGSVAVFGACIIGFGISGDLWLSMTMLFLSGAADGISVIIRQSLYQLHTPDAFRGRVASVNGVFVSISNEVGGFESGLAAQYLGAVRATVLGGFVAIAAVMMIRMKYPTLGKNAHAA